jgi:hypothetical protein
MSNEENWACNSTRQTKREREKERHELQVRLAKRDIAAPMVKSIVKFVNNRRIEFRGNVPISSTATCRARY